MYFSFSIRPGPLSWAPAGGEARVIGGRLPRNFYFFLLYGGLLPCFSPIHCTDISPLLLFSPCRGPFWACPPPALTKISAGAHGY